MKSRWCVVAIELSIAIVIGVVFVLYLIVLPNYITGFPEADFHILEKLNDNLKDFNLAIIVSFLVALIMAKSFTKGEINLKRIARNSTQVLLINSLLITASVVLGGYALIITVPAVVGNMIKFMDISENILEVL